MARMMMAVVVAFLPKRQQSTKCGSRKNGRGDGYGDGNGDGKGDGNSDNINDNDKDKEDYDDKEDGGSGSSIPVQQTPIN